MPDSKKSAKKDDLSKDDKQVPQFKNLIKNKQDKIKKFQREKMYAVKLRQVKINNFIKNEEAYNGVIQKTLLTRSNLHVPMVFEGVQNMSAKLGAAPSLKYDTIPEGDENAAEIMQHVVQEDLTECFWDQIYDNSKIECGIYGRTVYKVIPGNDRQRVELVDTLAYLISPLATNTKDALYQGQQFIYKTPEQLEEEKDEMEYDEEELDKLKKNEIAKDTQTDDSSEASTKNLRMANLGLANTTQYGSKVYEITEWWTYFPDPETKDPVLHVMTVANDIYLLRCKSAEELGLTGDACRPPFFSWGTFTRGITFWCPSVADVYRDPNLATDVTLNQGIDNNTYKNFGMLFVASSSGLKQSSIVPRPLGLTSVQVAPGNSIQDSVWQMPINDINDPAAMMQIVKTFADSAAGLAPTAAPGGKGKMNVTQQAAAQAQVDAKIAVMKRNATLCVQEMSQFMSDLITEKMTKPRKVKIFGYQNLTIEDVTKKNFKDVKLVAKAQPSEDSAQNKAIKQKAKIDLYELFKDDPKIPGQLALRRSVAKTFDIEPTELESWFKQETPPPASLGQQQPPQSPQDPQAQTPAPQTEATPMLSQTGAEAQAQVPPAIK